MLCNLIMKPEVHFCIYRKTESSKKMDWVALNVIDRRFKFFFFHFFFVLFFLVYIGNKNVLKLPAG